MPKQTPHVKRAIALTAALALTVSGITVHKGENAQAASKAPTLSASSVTLKKGQTKKIKINANKQKIKKVTWKVDKKKLKITKKTKKYAVVKALKTGSASISVTIVTNKKTYKKKVKVSVAAKKKATPKPVNTNKPSETTPSKTSDVPSVSNAPQESAPAVSEKPQETAPAVSEEPQETAPAASEEPQETAPIPTTKPSVSSKPVTPSKPVTSGITEVASTGSWNVGVLAKLPAYLRGRTVKFSLQMMEEGIAVGKNASSVSAGKAIQIISNYNGFPNLANISTEPSVWKTVSFTYRFNDFTNTDPILYFDVTDSVSATEKANVKIYVQNFTYEIVDMPDPLGGDCLALGSWDTGWDADGNWQDSHLATWHCGSPLSLRNDSLNPAAPHKAYENKKVRISLDVRVKGAPETPSGTYELKAQVDSWKNRVSIKEGITPSADWQTINEVVNFREIPQTWPSVIFVDDDHDAIDSATMEVFVRNVNIEILGEADATPTPAPSAGVIEGEAHDVYLNDVTGYDSTKGGVVISTTGAVAWYPAAMQKYGANSGITDKKFASVKIETEFYKDDVKVEPTDTDLQVLILKGTDWTNDKEAQKNIAAGTTTINETDMTASAIVFQWKKAEADITEYDTVIIKSIKLVEASASAVEDCVLTYGADSTATSGTKVWMFEDGEGYPTTGFNIANYSKAIVKFKFYKDGDVPIKTYTDATTINGKICLNGTTKDDYNGGTGDGFDMLYLSNVGRYENPEADENNIHTKEFALEAGADCITLGLWGNDNEVKKVEIVSVTLKAK